MALFETQRHFGWLAIQLMHAVHDRLGLTTSVSSIRHPIEPYVPVAYYNEEINRVGIRLIIWDGKPSSKRPEQPEQRDGGDGA